MGKLFYNRPMCRPILLPILLCGIIYLPSTVFSQLEWESHSIELRPTVDEPSVTVKFKFKNTGKYPVKIESIHSSCGCTTANTALKVYQPGESGDVEAQFNIGQRTGVQEKTISVDTDDPKESKVLLALKVFIPDLYDLKPSFISWKVGDKSLPKTVHLKLLQKNKVKIESVLPSHEVLAVELKPVQEGSEYDIVITPRDTSSELWGMITLRTDSTLERLQNIRIHSHITRQP
jgi:hypothetical protein